MISTGAKTHKKKKIQPLFRKNIKLKNIYIRIKEKYKNFGSIHQDSHNIKS